MDVNRLYTGKQTIHVHVYVRNNQIVPMFNVTISPKLTHVYDEKVFDISILPSENDLWYAQADLEGVSPPFLWPKILLCIGIYLNTPLPP